MCDKRDSDAPDGKSRVKSVQDPEPIKWRGAYALTPVALALLTSINSLRNGFAFDDIKQVLGNEFIRRLENLPLAFTTTVWSFDTESISVYADAYFRPLFTVLFMLIYAIFGTEAWGWHLVIVLIHCGVTFLVFLVIREVTGLWELALVGALLFAVHPAHSESVAWVSGVTDPLMALFALPAFYFYLRFRKSGRKALMAISLAFFFLALLSKETAIVFPPVIAICELFYFRDEAPVRKRFVRATIRTGLFTLPAAVYFLMRYNAISGLLMSVEGRFGIDTALATAPMVLVKYLMLSLIPVGYRVHHYTAPVTSVLTFDLLGPLAVLAAIATGIWLTKSRDLTFASGWFIIWLLPPLAGLQVFKPQHFVQERYLYLPSIGICLALAVVIRWLAARRIVGPRKGLVAIAGTTALLIPWSAVFINQNRVWHDTLTLFQHSVALDPRDPLARVDLSAEYFVAGRRQEAEREARTALELDPTCLDAYIMLSQFSVADGRMDAAVQYLERALPLVEEGPRRRGYLGRIHHDLGLTHEDRGDFDLAEHHLRQSVEILPYAKSWYTLGNFYFARGRYEEALAMYELVVSEASPRFAPIRLRLALTYDRLNQSERAVREYERFLELSPNAADGPEIRNRLRQLRTGT